MTSSLAGSVQAKNGKYYAVISYKDSAGKWRYKWKSTGLDIKGNKKRAQAVLDEFMEEYKNNLSSDHKILFADYMRQWLNLKKPQIEDVTYELYSHFIDIHLFPYFSRLNLSISEVTYNHLQCYVNEKFTNGKIKRKKADVESNVSVGLSSETLNKHKMVLKQVFDGAIHDKLIDSNPTKYVKIPKRQEKFAPFYTVDQANMLLDKLNGEMIRPIVLTALYYGLRRSEIAGLKWSAVSFSENKFCIEHTAVKSISGKTTYYKDSTKTKTSHSEFPLIDDVKQTLLQLKARQEENRIACGTSYFESDYVFTWADGTLIQPDYVSKKFKKLLKKHNMPDIHFHSLRHTTASILVKKGLDIKSIQMWLRHANVGTTLNIYAHVSENQKQVIAKDISNMFSTANDTTH